MAKRTAVDLADLMADLRRSLGAWATDAPEAQVIRAVALRYLGHSAADGAPANRGGRPKGYSPKRAREHAGQKTTPI